MKTVTVVATFKAKPGKEAELKKILLGFVAPTRKEAGCINYDLHELPDDPSQFLFHENWTSKAHLDAHLQNDLLKTSLPRVNELCASAEIKLWERIA